MFLRLKHIFRSRKSHNLIYRGLNPVTIFIGFFFRSHRNRSLLRNFQNTGFRLQEQAHHLELSRIQYGKGHILFPVIRSILLGQLQTVCLVRYIAVLQQEPFFIARRSYQFPYPVGFSLLQLPDNRIVF